MKQNKYIKLLNLIFNNRFHKNGTFFVHRLAARPLMAKTHMKNDTNLIDSAVCYIVMGNDPTDPTNSKPELSKFTNKSLVTCSLQSVLYSYLFSEHTGTTEASLEASVVSSDTFGDVL